MLKLITVIAMSVAILSLGACAHKEAAKPAPVSKGYSK